VSVNKFMPAASALSCGEQHEGLRGIRSVRRLLSMHAAAWDETRSELAVMRSGDSERPRVVCHDWGWSPFLSRQKMGNGDNAPHRR
jgi:hypothetical protein